MKRFAISAMLVAVLLVGVVYAADQPVTVTGVVSVTKVDNAVTAVKLTVDKTVYVVTLDTKGKELAALNGAKVKATGTVTEKDDVKTLTVTAFTKVVEKK